MQKVSAAFVAAQKEFGPALKSATNPHFRSKYADLSACVEAVIDALNNHGIAMTQQSQQCDSGVMVQTVFIHESGESINSGWLHIPASKNDPQGYGSALTYARRYSLMAACGIAPEDDDGNAARQTDQRQPDVSAIVKGIRGAATLEILKSSYEAAMQMLDPSHHPIIKKVTKDRKAELSKETV